MIQPSIDYIDDPMELPEVAYTRVENTPFYPRENVWRINHVSRNYTFNFETHFENHDTVFTSRLKALFCRVIANDLKISTSYNYFHYLGSFLAKHPECTCLSSNLLNQASTGEIPRLRAIILLWLQYRIPGLDSSIHAWLDYGPRIRKTDIDHYDIRKGAYSREEEVLIVNAMIREYASGSINLTQCLMLELLRLYGMRPETLIRLQCSHIIRRQDGGWILLKRIKGSGKEGYEDFLFRVPSELFAMLQEYVKERHTSSGVRNMEDLAFWPIMRTWSIGRKLRKMSNQFAIISPRTGELLKLIPNRFRHTRATRMAEEGIRAGAIQRALMHGHPSSSRRYVTNSHSTAEVIDGLNPLLKDVVSAFAGKIGDIEDLPEKTVNHPDAGLVGGCEKDATCLRCVPLACYQCDCFVAFKEANHGRVLNFVQQLYPSDLKQNKSGTLNGSTALCSDIKVTENAIAAVIECCKSYGQES